MPLAARISDAHTCPAHAGGPTASGEPSVLIGFMPAARVGDTLACVGPPDVIRAGEASVVIGHRDAARLGDPTAHGGVIVAGCPTVIIGSSRQAEVLRTNEPFCEECERKAKEREAAARRARQTETDDIEPETEEDDNG
jgi:uncharacterized Zn-binding protein involved in type VI secretion